MSEHAQRVRVAAAQVHISADMDANVRTITAAMAHCARQGVEVVVFPETAVTGYSPAIGRGRDVSEWPIIAGHLEVIAALAGELGLWTIVGCEAWADPGWTNRLYAYSDRGECVATYDKVHLMAGDRRYYQPGHGVALFEIKGVRVGLQICYDVRFPEGYRALLRQGVQVILQGFHGAGGDTWKVPVLGAHLRSRAAESGCFVVAANVAGPLQIVVSQIVDPLGLLLAAANQDREEIITAEVDLARIAESEIRHDYLQWFAAGG
ncbi:MAG: carbon-nitrogen hydrolase family protein [Chloroflexota bacterium]